MSRAPLLIEIGCEEIPARMIRSAADELAQRLVRILDQAGLAHGPQESWGGSRRLALRVAEVQARQADREEEVLGPPAGKAFDAEGRPGPAAQGFARKHGIDASLLETVATPRGPRVGFRRKVTGRDVAGVLADALPGSVQAMSFPKSMRWGRGQHRWVRPVHWLLALHGPQVLELELFGVRSGNTSRGHRFLGPGTVTIGHPEAYVEALARAHVVVEPARRRQRLAVAMEAAASGLGGSPVDDPELLDEVVELVEWPGVAAGGFDPVYLELPRELLVTTLRHHQKCFSVQAEDGRLLPAFLAVANTDRDPSGHVRRGNEWVIGGRLEDARFFWREDRQRTLDERLPELERVVFHARLGSYADKARRMERLARELGARVGLDAAEVEASGAAALRSKLDLVTGTVGEFPELQGQVGGLLLAHEQGRSRIEDADEVARAVYWQYRPAAADDELPPTEVGCVVSLADKLDSLTQLIGAGELPTSSRDPFGLRRAGIGVFRILVQRAWSLSLRDLGRASGADGATLAFLLERLGNFFRDQGATVKEVQAVFRPAVAPEDAVDRPIHDIAARLRAIRTVRRRSDFNRLVELTKRVDRILVQNASRFEEARRAAEDAPVFHEDVPAAARLVEMTGRHAAEVETLEGRGSYDEVIDVLAGFVQPVDRFFDDVLVIDPERPRAMLARRELLASVRDVLTRCFDIRELAGEADRTTTVEDEEGGKS